MELLKLKLENFKGIGKFEFNPNGLNGDIYGDNATGKTTVFDAFIWLLFDKDSDNRKDFNIKSIDKTGESVHHLEHSVTGIFSIGAKKVTLQKIFKEKWVRARGQAVEKFSSHTTDHLVNGVPCSKGEYTATIKEIADEKVFRLVTDPLYANEQLSWQELRDIIFEVCGNVSDEDVCSDKTLAPLLAYLNEGKSIDDMKKIVAARQRKINEDLKLIPARIAELSNMEQLKGTSEEELLVVIERLKSTIADKNSKLSMIANGGLTSTYKLKISELQVKAKEELAAINEDNISKREQLKEKVSSLKNEKSRINNEVVQAEYSIKNLKTEIADNENKINRLREQGNAACERQFKHEEINCTCPMCNQELPEYQLQAAKDKMAKMLEDFNLKKSEEVTEINAKGKALKAEIENSKERLESLIAENADREEEIKSTNKNIIALEEKINEIKTVETSETIEKINDEITELQNKIKNEAESSEKETSAIKAGIAELETKVGNYQEEIASIRQYAKTQERINELKEQQVTLAKEYEELSDKIFLVETFVRRKVEMVEQRINNKFKLARFKMYAENITNEGIAECCETTLDGVPYRDLNNAAKINVGLDIIRTLSEYYGFKAPIFVDNAEAVTKLIDMDTQIIRLIVSEPDKTLRIEVKE